jgi:hypothetical protein
VLHAFQAFVAFNLKKFIMRIIADNNSGMVEKKTIEEFLLFFK